MRQKIIAKAEKLKLTQKDNRWTMTGGKWGPHGLYEPCFNHRVSAHWEGYMTNNGIKWEGHPEYFPGKLI